MRLLLNSTLDPFHNILPVIRVTAIYYCIQQAFQPFSCNKKCVYTIPVNSPDFVGRLPISRISPDHPMITKNLPILDLAQDFLNLKINQFFKKINQSIAPESFFFVKGKKYTSTSVSTDFIFFKSVNLKINV